MTRVAGMNDGGATPSDLQQRLADSLATATKAEAAIAGFFLNNLQSLPFETAASVAGKIGVSEATIGRYWGHRLADR